MREYALIRFKTKTGDVIQIMSGKIASMLKINALNNATFGTSSVIVNMDNGLVIFAVYGLTKVLDRPVGMIDDLGIPFDVLKQALAD